MSSQPCGCDPEASWTCEQHAEQHARAQLRTELHRLVEDIERYDFECEGGLLVNAAPWRRLRELVEGL